MGPTGRSVSGLFVVAIKRRIKSDRVFCEIGGGV
jgi:hypothetical protein